MIFNWVAIRSFLLVAALSALLTAWLSSHLTFSDFILWLLSINLVTFLWFAKDKWFSTHETWPRTPEGAFMWMGLFGAFPALILGMFICKHKNAKPGFWLPMIFYMLVQLCLAYYFFGDVANWVIPQSEAAIPPVATTIITPAQ